MYQVIATVTKGNQSPAFVMFTRDYKMTPAELEKLFSGKEKIIVNDFSCKKVV